MSDNAQEEKLSPIYDSVVDMVLMGITGNNTLEFSPDGEGYNAPTLRASNGIVRIYDGVRTYIPPVAQVTLDTITGIALDSGEPLTWSGETISSGWGYVPIENPILRALLKATHPSAAIYDVTAGMITLLIPAPTPHPNKVIRVVVIDSSNPKNYQPQSDFRGGCQGPSNNRGYQTQSHSRELANLPMTNLRGYNSRRQMVGSYRHEPHQPYVGFSIDIDPKDPDPMSTINKIIDRTTSGIHSSFDIRPGANLPEDISKLESIIVAIREALTNSSITRAIVYLEGWFYSPRVAIVPLREWLDTRRDPTIISDVIAYIMCEVNAPQVERLGTYGKDVVNNIEYLRAVVYLIRAAIDKLKHKPGGNSMVDTTPLLPKDLVELEYLHKGILAYLLSGPSNLDEYLRKYLTSEQLTTLEFFTTWIQQFDRYTSYPIIVSLIVGTYKDLGWSNSDVESAYDKLRDLIASINEAIVLTKCKHREAVKSASLNDTIQVDSQQEPYTLGEIISDIHGYLIYGNSSGAIEELRKYLKDEQVVNLVEFKGWLDAQGEHTKNKVIECLIEQAWIIIPRAKLANIDRLNLAVDIIGKTMRGFMSILKVEISTLSGTKSTGGSIAHTLVSDSGLQSSTVVKDTGKLWRGTLDVKEVNRLYGNIENYVNGKPDVNLRLAPVTMDEAVCLNVVKEYWGAACKDLGPDIHNYPLLSQLTAMLGLLADGMPDSFKLRDRKHYQEVVHSFGAVISLIKEMTNFINGGDAKPISLPENPLFATLHEKLFPSPIPPEVQYSEEKFS